MMCISANSESTGFIAFRMGGVLYSLHGVDKSIRRKCLHQALTMAVNIAAERREQEKGILE